MAVGTEVVAVRYEDIVAGTPISVPYPVYEALDVFVYYGAASLRAVLNTDYTVSLADDFDTFTLTPLQSLIDKIDALIAADPTNEENYITVRRQLDYLTDSTAAAVRYTPFTSREFERTALRFQQLAERFNRALVLSPNFVGDEPLLQLNALKPGASLRVNDAGNAIEPGPQIPDIDAQFERAKEQADRAESEAGYAEEWAQSNSPISVQAGGDGLTDQSSKTWALRSETDADRAETAADTASAAASSAQMEMDSRAYAAASYNPDAAPNKIRTAGYASAGDGGGALYKKVVSEPSHAGKFSITLSDGVTVVWYEIAEKTVTPHMFGARGDGDFAGGGSDDTAAVIAWAAFTGAHHKRFTSIYRTTAQAVFNPGDFVEGYGSNTGIDASGAASWSDKAMLHVSGALTKLANRTTFSNKGEDYISHAGVGLEPGNVLLIWNANDYSYSPWRPSYRAGEYARVHSKDGTKVQLFASLYDSYGTDAGTEVHRLDGKSTVFQNFRIAQPPLEKAGLLVSLIDSPRVVNVLATGGLYVGVELDRCVDFHLDIRATNASPIVGDEYGAALSNCHGGQVFGFYDATRHGISIGGSGIVGCVPVRNIDIYVNRMAASGDIGAQDLHGHSEDIRFHGGRFQSGVIAGKNQKWFGCTFVGRNVGGSQGGIAVSAGECVEGTFVFDACDFIGYGSADDASFGLISLLNLTDDVSGPLKFVFNNCGFDPGNTKTRTIDLQLNGITVDVSIEVINPRVLRNLSMIDFLRLQRISGIATMSLVKVVGITGLKPGAAYATNAGGGLTVDKYEMPMQRGSVTLSPASTSVAVATTAVTFDYKYPVPPKVYVSKNQNNIGGKNVSVAGTVPTTSGFTASAITTTEANFTSTASGTADWFAVV